MFCVQQSGENHWRQTKPLLRSNIAIGAKPNIYCEAIELVCGGSPKICVLVEWKALDRVKSEL